MVVMFELEPSKYEPWAVVEVAVVVFCFDGTRVRVRVGLLEASGVELASFICVPLPISRNSGALMNIRDASA